MASSETDIFEIIRQDHEKVASIFEKIEGASDRSSRAREKDFARLQGELLPHAQAEEELFYSRLMNEDHRAHTLEALEEHHLITVVINELKETDPGDERWMAKVAVLKEVVEHHVEEEEGQTFDDAGELLSNDEAEELGRQFQARKQELLPAVTAKA